MQINYTERKIKTMTKKEFETNLIQAIQVYLDESDPEDGTTIKQARAIVKEGGEILESVLFRNEDILLFSLQYIAEDFDSHLEARKYTQTLSKCTLIFAEDVTLKGDYSGNLETLYKLYKVAKKIK